MNLLDTTDAELPSLLSSSPKIVLMLTTAHCPICEQLLPAFARFAANTTYASVTFLHVDTDENPAARQRLGEHTPPVFAGYEQNQAVGYSALFTEQQLRAFLDVFRSRSELLAAEASAQPVRPQFL